MAFKSFLPEFKQMAQKQIENNMSHLTLQYQTDLKTKLDVPPSRSGNVYYNLKGKKIHIASAPGEPPAPLSRDLLESISNYSENSEGNTWQSFVYSDKSYAVALELGREVPTVLEPRPAWKATLDDNKDKYSKIASQGFARRSI